jgi:hypothetical protein
MAVIEQTAQIPDGIGIAEIRAGLVLGVNDAD